MNQPTVEVLMSTGAKSWIPIGIAAVCVGCSADEPESSAGLSGTVTWGFDDGGQLGIGDMFPRGDQTGEMGDNLPAVDL